MISLHFRIWFLGEVTMWFFFPQSQQYNLTGVFIVYWTCIFKLAILFFFVVVFVVYIYIYISPERHNTNRETPPLEVIPDKLLNFIVLKEYYTVRKSHKIERITYKTTNLFQKHSVAKLLYSKPVFPYIAPPVKTRLLLHEHFPLSKHISGLLSKCISDENYKFQSYFRKLYNIKDCSVKLKYSSLSGKV